MTTTKTLTVRDGKTLHWFGALCPVADTPVGDVDTLIRCGRTIGSISHPIARQAWHLVIAAPDTDSGVSDALELLRFQFARLASPGYSFRMHFTNDGAFWGWWPDE